MLGGYYWYLRKEEQQIKEKLIELLKMLQTYNFCVNTKICLQISLDKERISQEEFDERLDLSNEVCTDQELDILIKDIELFFENESHFVFNGKTLNFNNLIHYNSYFKLFLLSDNKSIIKNYKYLFTSEEWKQIEKNFNILNFECIFNEAKKAFIYLNEMNLKIINLINDIIKIIQDKKNNTNFLKQLINLKDILQQSNYLNINDKLKIFVEELYKIQNDDYNYLIILLKEECFRFVKLVKHKLKSINIVVNSIDKLYEIESIKDNIDIANIKYKINECNKEFINLFNLIYENSNVDIKSLLNEIQNDYNTILQKLSTIIDEEEIENDYKLLNKKLKNLIKILKTTSKLEIDYEILSKIIDCISNKKITSTKIIKPHLESTSINYIPIPEEEIKRINKTQKLNVISNDEFNLYDINDDKEFNYDEGLNNYGGKKRKTNKKRKTIRKRKTIKKRKTNKKK